MGEEECFALDAMLWREGGRERKTGEGIFQQPGGSLPKKGKGWAFLGGK